MAETINYAENVSEDVLHQAAPQFPPMPLERKGSILQNLKQIQETSVHGNDRVEELSIAFTAMAENVKKIEESHILMTDQLATLFTKLDSVISPKPAPKPRAKVAK